jgi:hypothetical protein
VNKSSSEVICRIFFTRNQLLRMEELAIGASANLVHHLARKESAVGMKASNCDSISGK